MKRRDEVLVGILLVAATIVGVLGTLWLVRGGLTSGYNLYTIVPWGNGLTQGQPVLLAGAKVGYVGDVTLRPNGTLLVTLKVDKDYKIPQGSTATVKAVGLFGDQSIAITPDYLSRVEGGLASDARSTSTCRPTTRCPAGRRRCRSTSSCRGWTR